MKECYYCQKPIAKGEKKKTIYSRITNLETGKTSQFLDDIYYHLACYAQLLETREQLKARIEARGAKVIY